MANRLADENSLYLRQHGDNPVDWYPWGDEALAKAMAEDKPLLVSIGYSACHWCHVMAHECFENDYIAQLMNEHFVCVKVDREERPDVDRVYMEAIQMLMGHGGWPLNVFCLPDGRPFAGGTYFPPEERGNGLTPWPQVLMRVADFYKRQKSDLVDNAENIAKNLAATNDPLAPSQDGATVDGPMLLRAAQRICEQHDDEYGGFGEAPKFPPGMVMGFLNAIRGAASVEDYNPQFAERLDMVITRTLHGMAHGGLFDQIGGGFARYSVDKYWIIPHFEKMLYDNGQLLEAYAKAWRRYRVPLFEAVVAETIGWLEREMMTGDGLFAAALDADSEGVEGKFYVWTVDEVKAVLGDQDGETFCKTYCITERGNFEGNLNNPVLGDASFANRMAVEPLRAKLLKARAQRVRPGKDDKVILGWNALAAQGIAEAAWTFGNTVWLKVAQRTLDALWETLADADGRMRRVYYADGGARFAAGLADYADYAEALLSLAGKIDWVEPGASQRYIERARQVANTVLRDFRDPEGQPGFFFTGEGAEDLVARRKEWLDNAVPSGNSTLVHVFAGIYALTGDSHARAVVDHFREGYPGYAERYPNAVGHALAGFTEDLLGIATIKVKGSAAVGQLENLRAALCERPWRETYVLVTDAAEQPEGFQLCVGTQCLAPETGVNAVATRL